MGADRVDVCALGHGYLVCLLERLPILSDTPGSLIPLRKAKLELLAQQETLIAKVIEPLLPADMPRTPKEELRAQGAFRASQLDSWTAMAGQLKEDLPPYVELYRLLERFGTQLKPADKELGARLDILAYHEEALLEFAEIELQDGVKCGDESLAMSKENVRRCVEILGSDAKL
jgi:hypothetical protein